MKELISNSKISDFPMITSIIPVYNRLEDIKRLLNSFRIINYPGKVKMIIIDDASTVDYSSIFKDFIKKCPHIDLSVIKMTENVGPAKCRNTAIEKIQTGYVWFLDSDTELFQSDMLKKAVEIFKNNPEIGGIGEEIFLQEGEGITHFSKWYPNYLFNVSFYKFENSPSGYRTAIATANLIVDRKMFEQVGMFNSQLELFEDNDFCFRLGSKGYKLYSCKEFALYHHTSSRGREGTFAFYNDLKKYTKSFHRNRVKLIFLNRRYILPFLPGLDLIYGFLIFFTQIGRKYNASTVISSKKDKTIGMFPYAFCHFFGMINCYYYAYKVSFTGRL